MIPISEIEILELVDKLKPHKMKTVENRIKNDRLYDYKMSCIQLENFLSTGLKKDLTEEEVKIFLSNYQKITELRSVDEANKILGGLTISTEVKEIENLIYFIYMIFINLYKVNEFEKSHNHLKNFFQKAKRYVIRKNSIMETNFYSFMDKSNKSFFDFLIENMRKETEEKRGRFYENYMIEFQSELYQDLDSFINKEY